MLGQDTTDVLAYGSVNVKSTPHCVLLNGTLTSLSGLIIAFIILVVSANIHHSFIKMAYIPVFKA